ncbi:iron-containing alcohol dehydrogenase [Anaerovibrio slackiae]|uniref:iron-containing alcohol dehydrogenase n=1 Tax=Anaerovibrio slackiae TaxID=2652309 RepID=UPI003868361C
MQSFEYYSPTEIIFGKGAEEKTAEKVKKHGGSRVFIVYGGGSVVKSGLLARLQNQLEAAGIPYDSIGGVQPNPLMSLARKGIQQALEFKADFILAVGGGSVIDTSKAIAHGIADPEVDIWEYWSGKRPITKTTPVGVVLTISAAGSETSNSAVLTDDEIGKKCGTNTDLNRPRFAIMNPELTYTLPPYQIACGTADIIMHTLERYMTHTEGNNFTDRVAEELIKNVMKFGKKALANRKDYEAMSELMWCGSVSHTGFTGLGRVMDFAAHKLGHELGGKFNITHGASLTIMWPAWARHVYMDKPERFAQFAERVCGVNSGTVEERARAGIRTMEEFFKNDLGLPTCFSESEIGVQDESVLEYLADMCTGGGKNKVANFRPLDRENCLAIYRAANH